MEKVYLKPKSTEFAIKGSSKEGHTDIFAYEYSADHAKRKLGSLFLVGNVQEDPAPKASGEENVAETPESIDVAYVINLVASLAKREYYSRTDLLPKEAFSSSLKKINDVIEEFFKNKRIKVNVGMFAVAGEHIYISKLGKFKILLARNNRNIDILNNVDLFSKDQAKEHEFSAIVSGTLMDKDRLLAFYPSRAMVAREKTIKDALLNLDAGQFTAKLAAIKEEKPDFACGALYVDLVHHKETAVMPKPQPHELKKHDPVLKNDTVSRPAKDHALFQEPSVQAEIVSRPPAAKEELPHIIPAEFSLGKKVNPVIAFLKKIEPFYKRPQNKTILFVSAAAMIFLVIFIIKTFVLITPEQRHESNIISEARANLKVAQTKINQDDQAGARQLLTDSLAQISALEQDSDTSKAENDISSILDNIDKAEPVSLALVLEIPADFGKGMKLAASGNYLAAQIAKDANSGLLVKIAGGSIVKQEATPAVVSAALAADTGVILLNYASNQVAIASFSDPSVKLKSITTSSPLVRADLYEGNLYLLQATTISKIADANKGASTVQKWLKDNVSLAPDSRFIAVDGKVYVLSGNGTLTTYYKNDKAKEFNTRIIPPTTDGGEFMTSKDSANLYLVSKALGRIYVLDKNSGSLKKTIKTGAQGLAAAALGPGDTIYILSKDNKVWKVQ